MNFPLKTPEEYGLPDGVEVIDEVQYTSLKPGDFFSEGRSGKIYKVTDVNKHDSMLSVFYVSYDIKTGHELEFGYVSPGSEDSTVFLMRVPEGLYAKPHSDTVARSTITVGTQVRRTLI